MKHFKLLARRLDRLKKHEKTLYVLLYDEYVDLLQIFNPCQFEGNRCAMNRQNKLVNGCCGKCSALSYMGCQVQSLGCKSILCEKAFNNLPPEGRAAWRELDEIKEKYFSNLKNKE
jgi:hypothetical protein